MLRAPVEVRRRRVSGSDQADASRGERQRRGLGAWEGRDAARWRRRTHLAEGHRAGKGCVCGMECAEAVEACQGVSRRGHLVRVARGDAQNAELREQGYVCAEACCRVWQGGGAGRDFERLEEPWVGPPGALPGGKDVQTQDVSTQDVCDV